MHEAGWENRLGQNLLGHAVWFSAASILTVTLLICSFLSGRLEQGKGPAAFETGLRFTLLSLSLVSANLCRPASHALSLFVLFAGCLSWADGKLVPQLGRDLSLTLGRGTANRSLEEEQDAVHTQGLVDRASVSFAPVGTHGQHRRDLLPLAGRLGIRDRRFSG